MPIVQLLALLACNPPIEVNTPPFVQIRNLDDGSVINQGEPFELLVRLRDRDGDEPLALVVTTDRSESLLADISDIPEDTIVSVMLNDMLPGEHVISAIASDGKDLREQVITIRVNARPSAPVIVITDAPTTRDDIEATLDKPAVDPDETPVTYSWSWAEPAGGTLFGADFPAVVSAALTEKSQVWEFCVETSEADDKGAKLEGGIQRSDCMSVTVANLPPGDPGPPSILPANPSPADTLGCVLGQQAKDPDPADTVSYIYSWEVDGVTLSGVDGAYLDAGLASSGQQVSCTATAFDGDDLGGSASSGLVVVGGSTMGAANADLRIDGTAAGQQLGPIAVAISLDDVPGVDLVLGVPGAQLFGLDAGLLAVFEGASLVADTTLSGRQATLGGYPGEGLGALLFAAPDIDGDGANDLLTTLPGDGLLPPEVRVVPGGSILKGTAPQMSDDAAFITLVHNTAAAGFGVAISAGNVDAGPQAEVFVTQAGAGNARSVWRFSGAGMVAGAQLSTDGAIAITSDQADDGFGASIDASGDYNGDGLADLIIGAPGRDSGDAVWLFLDTAFANTLTDASATVTTPSAVETGAQVFAFPDIDGDGLDDFGVSTPAAQVGGNTVGEVSFYLGAASYPTPLSTLDAYTRVVGTELGARFGERVVVVGDQGADGVAELAVAAPMANSASGQVLVFVGSTLAAGGTPTTADAVRVVNGELSGDALTLAGAAGDLDEDGFADLVLASGANSSGAGRLYLLFTGL